MAARFPWLLSLSLVGGVAADSARADAIPQLTWSGAAGSDFSAAANWSVGTAPTSADPADLFFNTSLTGYDLTLSATLNVRSLTFHTTDSGYTIHSANGATLGIGGGGITTSTDNDRATDFDGPLGIVLLASQTWTTNARLMVDGPISGGSDAQLVKDGSNSLLLSGNNTFSGGVNLRHGTLYLASDTALGTGTLTLSGGTFAPWFTELTLANPVLLADGVTFGNYTSKSSYQTSYSTPTYNRTTFTSAVTASADTVGVALNPGSRTNFSGGLAGTAGGTSLTFSGGGAAAFSGTTAATITGITASGAALIFDSLAALPAANLQAANGGYVGMTSAFDGAITGGHASPADFIARITAKSDFSGTIGFDSDPAAAGTNTFHGTIDESDFTNACFLGLGTASTALLASDATILPPTDSDYKFGGGGGRLVVATDLTAATGLSVASTETSPLTLVLQGDNRFTGDVHVTDSFLVFDAANAFPAVSGQKIHLGDNGYVSSTPNGLTPASLIGRIAATDFEATGVIGFDSVQPATAGRVVTDDIDLRVLATNAAGASATLTDLPYLGTTTTGLELAGNIFVPSGLPLKLVAANGGSLLVSSALTAANGVSSVVVGHPTTDIFGSNGTVSLTGVNTYAGGTTVLNGTLELSTSSMLSGSTIVSGPVGTGTLTLADGMQLVPTDAAAGVTLDNPIVLTGGLVQNNNDDDDARDLTLNGFISGDGGFDWCTPRALILTNAANTFAGGVDLREGTLLVSGSSVQGDGSVIHGPAGTGTLTLWENTTLGVASSATGPVTLHNAITLYTSSNNDVFIDTGSGNLALLGDISGNAPLIKHGAGTLTLGGDNSFTGPIGLNEGTVAISADRNLGAVPDSTVPSYLQFSGGTLETTADVDLNSNRGITIDGQGTLQVDAGTTLSYSGLIADASLVPAELTKSGLGTLILSGSNTFSGGLTVEAGTLQLGTSSTFRVESTVLQDSPVGVGALTLLDGATLTTDPSAESITLANAIVLDSNPAAAVTFDTSHSDLVLSGKISGEAQLFETGGNRLTLSGRNTFSGGLTVESGASLYLGTSTRDHGNNTADPLTFTSGPVGTGTLTLGSDAQIVPSGAAVTLANPIVLTGGLVHNDDDHNPYNLTLGGSISGAGGLDWCTSGTLTLTNAASTFSGGVDLREGTLLVGGASALVADAIARGPVGTGDITTWYNTTLGVADGTVGGATLHNNIALQYDLTLDTTHGNLSLFGVISGNAGFGLALTTSAGGTLTLGGANTFNGSIRLGQSTTLAISSDANLGQAETNNVTDTRVGLSLASRRLSPANDSGNSLIFSDATLETTADLTLDSHREIRIDSSGATLSPDNGTTLTFAGTISDVFESSGKLTKSGAGTLVLGGTNFYSGGTSISQGTLVAAANNSLGSGAVTLNGGRLSVDANVSLSNVINFGAGGGTLRGNGTFSRAIVLTTGIVLAPGNSVGHLNFAAGLTWSSGGSYEVEVQDASGAAGTGYDTASVTGSLAFTASIGSPFTIYLKSLTGAGAAGNVANFVDSVAYTWTIADATELGNFSTVSPATLVVDTSGFTNSFSGTFSLSTSGNSALLNYTPAAVPEPSTWVLLATGVAALAFWSRRKRTA